MAVCILHHKTTRRITESNTSAMIRDGWGRVARLTGRRHCSSSVVNLTARSNYFVSTVNMLFTQLCTIITVHPFVVNTHLLDVIWTCWIHAIWIQSPFNIDVFHMSPDWILDFPVYNQTNEPSVMLCQKVGHSWPHGPPMKSMLLLSTKCLTTSPMHPSFFPHHTWSPVWSVTVIPCNVILK